VAAGVYSSVYNANKSLSPRELAAFSFDPNNLGRSSPFSRARLPRLRPARSGGRRWSASDTRSAGSTLMASSRPSRCRARGTPQRHHLSTLSSIQMLPVAVAIVSIARRAEMPVSVSEMSGSTILRGESNRVIMNGAPTGLPPCGSNRTPHRLKKCPGWRDRGQSVRPCGAQRGCLERHGLPRCAGRPHVPWLQVRWSLADGER
jgi:hypothetical protein